MSCDSKTDSQQETRNNATPWEHRKAMRFFPAFFKTVREILLNPGRFYAGLSKPEKVKDGVLFFLFIQLVYFTAGYVWFAVQQAAWPNFWTVIVLAAFLVLCLGLVCLGAGILHVFILLFKGQGRYQTTLLILLYSSAASLFMLIPRLGVFIFLVWATIANIAGTRVLHRMSRKRAIAAYGAPGALALALLALLISFQMKGGGLAARNNDIAAAENLRRISTAAEKYSQAHAGAYPVDPLELRKLIGQEVCGINFSGYVYSCSLEPDGYAVTATPVLVGRTGSRAMTVRTGGVMDAATRELIDILDKGSK